MEMFYLKAFPSWSYEEQVGTQPQLAVFLCLSFRMDHTNKKSSFKPLV